MPGLTIQLRAFAAMLAALFLPVATWGAMPPSEELLPATTKGYASIPDVEKLLAAFDRTGMGRLSQEPSMQEFAEDLQFQLNERFGLTGVRVGITWEDLRDICVGEVAVATILTDDPVQRHSLVALCDAQGKSAEVASLLTEVDESMAQRQAKRRTENWGGTTVTIYTVPLNQRGQTTFDAVLFTIADTFVASDHPMAARDVLRRLQGQRPGPSLSQVRAYQICMKRCAADAAGLQPHARWFVEPLGYAELAREATEGRRRRRTDYLKALRNEGLDAIEGIGGFVNLDTESYEILQRAFIYAPPSPGGDEPRFRLAARMLSFHRVEDLAVENWIPDDVSSYFCGTWDIQKSYEYIGSLIDEVAGGEEGFWEDFKESFRVDESGPQIDLDTEIVAHLGTRVTAITDFVEPITTTSERFLVAIALTNPDAMRKSLAKTLEEDPDANPINVDEEHVIWEIVSDSEEAPTLEIEGGSDFDLGLDENYEDEMSEDDTFLSSVAIAVVQGKLMVSSHVDFIREMIEHPQPEAALMTRPEILEVRQALSRLGADEHTAEAFSHAADQMRVSYQLLQEGKMPESQGLIGLLLNEVLGPEDPNMLREQRIHGDKLPDFSLVQRYLGVAGAYLKAEEDGWFTVAVGLPRAPVEETAAEEKPDVEEEPDVETASRVAP